MKTPKYLQRLNSTKRNEKRHWSRVHAFLLRPSKRSPRLGKLDIKFLAALYRFYMDHLSKNYWGDFSNLFEAYCDRKAVAKWKPFWWLTDILDYYRGSPGNAIRSLQRLMQHGLLEIIEVSKGAGSWGNATLTLTSSAIDRCGKADVQAILIQWEAEDEEIRKEVLAETSDRPRLG